MHLLWRKQRLREKDEEKKKSSEADDGINLENNNQPIFFSGEKTGKEFESVLLRSIFRVFLKL